jgi:hypothetical protein
VDALTKKALARLGTFTTFLSGVTGKTGFLGGAITEVGIPQARADSSPPAAYVADVPLWQKLYHEWYRAADDAGLWVLPWASGPQWGDYNLGMHVNDSVYTYPTGTNIDKMMSPGGLDVAEAHPAPAGVYWRRGVNIAGGEFGHKQPGYTNANPGTHGTDYYFPTAADAAALAARRIRTVRLPIAWERLQPTLLGALNSTYLSYISTFVTACATNGIGVILDLHNYARYEYDASGTKKVLVLRVESGIDTNNPGPTGEDGGKIGPEYLSDVWARISDSVIGRDNAAVIAYEIMNEPHDVAPSSGSFSGSVLNAWNDGTVQGWSGGIGATLSHTTSTPYEGSGALRVSGTTGTAGQFFNLRAERGSVSGTGNSLRGRVRMNGTPTGSWEARWEWQNQAFQWQQGAVTPLTAGQWVSVLSDFSGNPIPGDAQNLCLQIQTNNPGGAEAVSFDVDQFERGTLSGAYTQVEAWEQISQAVLTHIRTRPDNTSRRDTKILLVPGHGWNVLGWDHDSAWLTEPAGLEGEHAYVTHHYFDSQSNGNGEGEGVYQTADKRYADALSYAVSQGFTNDGDTTAPTISSLVATPSGSSCTVTWTTNENGDSRVEYGVDNSLTPAVFGSTSTRQQTGGVTSHSVTLNDLTGGSTYKLRAWSRDAAGNLAESSTITVAITGDIVISDVEVEVNPANPSQVTITCTTSVPAVVRAEYQPNAAGPPYASSTSDTAFGLTHTVILSGLSPDTLYHFRLRAEG